MREIYDDIYGISLGFGGYMTKDLSMCLQIRRRRVTTRQANKIVSQVINKDLRIRPIDDQIDLNDKISSRNIIHLQGVKRVVVENK